MVGYSWGERSLRNYLCDGQGMAQWLVDKLAALAQNVVIPPDRLHSYRERGQNRILWCLYDAMEVLEELEWSQREQVEQGEPREQGEQMEFRFMGLGSIGRLTDEWQGARTLEEIVAKCQLDDSDPSGYIKEALIPYLPFDFAKPWLGKGVSREEWSINRPSPVRDSIIGKMRNHMAFAWSMVENHRNPDVNYSITMLSAWIWLLGDEQILVEVENTPYPQYGVPKLALVCKIYGFRIPESREIQRLIRGLPRGGK